MRLGSTFFRCLLLTLLLSLLASPGALGDKSPTESGSPEVREIRLDNGLRIFVLERTASPTFAAYYQFGVGGATDPKGRSGIAHLLEHMMFKGTKSVGTLDPAKEREPMQEIARLWDELHRELDRRDDPFRPADEEKIVKLQERIEEVSARQKPLIVKNEYDELMTRAGSVSMNASTNWDVTRYYIQLPANRLEFWFKLESDRLLNPVFREFYSERDVVYEERRMRTENTADGRARESMNGLLYSAHPYGTPVVGWPRDLLRLERQDAMNYFTTYYSPSNCIMVLAGDLKATDVERLAKKYFGTWKKQDVPRLAITSEPEQTGERRAVIEFDAKPALRMAWRTVPEGHADQYPLDVLSTILGGVWSSRIDQTIVQSERIASGAGAGHSGMKHDGYFSVSGTLRGEHTAAELESALDREIGKIQEDGVTADEIEKARIVVEARRVRGLKSNLGQAFRVGNSVYLTGGPDYTAEYERRINAVTPEQVKDVAQRYLKPERKCVVEVRTVEDGPGADGGGRGDVSHGRGGTSGARGAKHSVGFGAAMKLLRGAAPIELKIPEIGKDLRRERLPSGITVFIKEDHSAPSVQMSFSWLGGYNTVPLEELPRYELASDLLTEGGTESLTPADLELRRDELGVSFGMRIGNTQSSASFWSLSRNFEESFDLALEMLSRPRFDAERLETLKGQYIESMRRRQDSPARGSATVLQHVINQDHPRLAWVPTRAQIESVTPEAVRQAWLRNMGRDNLYLSVVGDFEEEEMLASIEKKLGSWRKAESAERDFLAHEPFLHAGAYLVEKDLPQPSVRIYHQIAVDRTAPMEEHAALEILNDILGGSGFRSRLMERLRSDEGLTYGIGSGLSHEGRPGVPGRISISYQTKQESVAHSIASVLEEFRRIIKEKVSAPEVQEQIEAWRNRFVFRYTDDFSIVTRLLVSELDDRPYDYDRLELDAVQRVTVDDVQRVAKKYLAPDRLTIAIFGTLTEADRKALAEKYTLKVLAPEEVFTGGYEEEAVAAEGQP